MKVGIVVVNFNNSSDTIECISSLLNDNYQDKAIFVIDNASRIKDYNSLSKYIDSLESRFEVKLIKNPENYGFSGGYNTGLIEVMRLRFDFALILNNDTIVTNGFLQSMVSTLRSEASVGIVGGKIFYHDEPDILWTVGGRVSLLRGGSYYFGNGERDSKKYDNCEITHVSGCMALISRQVLMSVGIFDERFFWRGEEWDYCYRIKTAGFKAKLSPEAVIYHKISRTVDRFSVFDLYCGYRAKLLFISKHFWRPMAGLWKVAFKVYLKGKYKKIETHAKKSGSKILDRDRFNLLVDKIYEDDAKFKGVTIESIREVKDLYGS